MTTHQAGSGRAAHGGAPEDGGGPESAAGAGPLAAGIDIAHPAAVTRATAHDVDPATTDPFAVDPATAAPATVDPATTTPDPATAAPVIDIGLGHGPAAPPAAAALTGLRDPRCLRYGVRGRGTAPLGGAAGTPAGTAHALIGHRICADDELVWDLFPDFDAQAHDVRDGFRAAAVAIDLFTDDGRHLLCDGARETDHTSALPADRPDLDFPDQWNERRIALAPLAGATITAVALTAEPPQARGETSATVTGWIDGIRLDQARRLDATASPSAQVTTTRGSHSSPQRSRGLTQPLTGVPHGGLYVAPATDLSNAHWTYSWNAHGPGPLPVLAGMLVTRAPSIWIGDRGALALRIGAGGDAPDAVTAEEFSHDDEVAQPHRYRVQTTAGTAVDAVATDHAVVVTAAFPGPGRIVITAPGVELEHVRIVSAADAAPSSSADVIAIDATSCLPSPHEPDPLRAFYRITATAAGGPIAARVRGSRVIVDAPSPGTTVRLDIGSSQLSIGQAGAAQCSVSGHSVDAIAAAAMARWDGLLDSVTAPGVPGDDAALIASDLYRMFLYPTRHDEDTGAGPRYPSPTVRERPDTAEITGRAVRAGRMMTDNGFWDTYRTVWPAYALLVPAQAGAMLDAMLEHVRDGGWSPRWTAGTPLDAMVGTSLDVIAAEFTQAQLTGFDQETAYLAALRNATTPSSDPRFGRKGMPEALVRGFVDAGVAESVSWTMEGAISDAGAAVLARAVARRRPGSDGRHARAEARYLASRALAYRHLWDGDTGFFRPRHGDGSWADAPFDPRVWGGGHTETNAWGSRFAAPHDGHGLAALFGGGPGLRHALDAFFTDQETGRLQFAGSYGQVIHEMLEARDVRRGMWGVSNQPAHHVPWLYAYTDEPWRAGLVAADALHRLFRGMRIGQGYPGDEDNGEMSAWHLLATMGLVPFAPGSAQLLVIPPHHDLLRVAPVGAPPLVIRAHRRDRDDRFITAVRFNGRAWTSPTVGIAELHAGGEWEVELGPAPVAWSEPVPDLPFFAPDGARKLDLDDVASPAPTLSRRVGRDATLDIVIATPEPQQREALLVIAVAEPGVHSFQVELPQHGDAVVLHERDAPWRWAGQARPFEVSLPAGTSAVRLRWLGGDATVTLVQLLA